MNSKELKELREQYTQSVKFLTETDYIKNPDKFDILFEDTCKNFHKYRFEDNDFLLDQAVGYMNEIIFHFYKMSTYKSKIIHGILLRYPYEESLLEDRELFENDELRLNILEAWSPFLISNALENDEHSFWSSYTNVEAIRCLPRVIQTLHHTTGNDDDNLSTYLDQIYKFITRAIRRGHTLTDADALSVGYILTLDQNNTNQVMFDMYKDLLKEHIDIQKVNNYNSMLKTLGLEHTIVQWFDSMSTHIKELNLPELN